MMLVLCAGIYCTFPRWHVLEIDIPQTQACQETGGRCLEREGVVTMKTRSMAAGHSMRDRRTGVKGTCKYKFELGLMFRSMSK